MLKKILWWLPTIFVMAVIFVFSMETGSESEGLSSLISSWLHMPEFLIRKLAHVTEYLILTLCVLLALRKAHDVSVVKSILFAFGISVFYAASDEVHQYFVAGRHGCFTDVLIDSIGAFVASGGYFLIKKIKKQI